MSKVYDASVIDDLDDAHIDTDVLSSLKTDYTGFINTIDTAESSIEADAAYLQNKFGDTLHFISQTLVPLEK